jgi:hypothetical protein
VNGNVHTNTVDGFFGLLKRGINNGERERLKHSRRWRDRAERSE